MQNVQSISVLHDLENYFFANWIISIRKNSRVSFLTIWIDQYEGEKKKYLIE